MQKGLFIVYTGDGKGKTTAALGLAMRALGHGQRVCMIQFIKPENEQIGEFCSAQRLGIEWHAVGDGFTWLSTDPAQTARQANLGWQLVQQKIISKQFDLIILDEFTYALMFKWLNTREILEWLHLNRPENLNLVITGRYAPKELISSADLVSEIHSIKHPFTKGLPAQAGIEY